MPKSLITGAYPSTRMRRIRQNDWARRLTRETRASPDDLVWGMIVHDGTEKRVPVKTMPGVDRLNIDEAARAAVRARELGIPAIAIFPHIDAAKKDERGEEALNPGGLIPEVIRAMKAAAPEVGIACDVALDPFTSHGHDGLLNEAGYVVNDETVAMLTEQALVQARAGADIVAPSDMMDGRIGAIRDLLDEDKAILETIGAFKRAGASGVITYFAERAAQLLGK